MSDDLLRRWATTGLPSETGWRLLERWNEPHRHYHGPGHVAHGLDLLADLRPRDSRPAGGAGTAALVELAWWFHDAVHHHDPPHDEQASAALARAELTGLLPDHSVSEVERLVMVTLHHQPSPEDDGGALISDIDLHALSMPWPTYLDHVEGLHRELPELNDQDWAELRRRQLQRLSDREWVFHTQIGRREWEPAARANLVRELGLLRNR